MSIKFNLVQKANPRKLDGEKKWYAVPSSESAMDGKALTRAATANTSTSAIEMEAAMEYLAAFIPVQLLQGHTVKVPGLGSFRISFKSRGVSDITSFNAGNMISDVRILYTPDKSLRDSILSDIGFENGGVLKDNVRYASVSDYLRAIGEAGGNGSAGDETPDEGGGATGGNPL